MESVIAVDNRNGGCGAIFENKLYVWGGETTDKYCPYKDLQLSPSDSDSEATEGSDSDSEEKSGAPALDPNFVIKRDVNLPRLNDPHHPFDVLDLSTRLWSKQPTSGDFPNLGIGSSLNAYPPTHSLYLYSGWKDGEFDSEIYKVVVDEWKWEILEPATSVKPSPRYLTGVVVHGSHMSVFGGVGKEIVPGQDPGAKYEVYINNGVVRYYGWNNEYYEFDFDSRKITHTLSLSDLVDYFMMLYLHLLGEWTAPLGREAHRPDPIGTFAFTKFDPQRAIMFGGSGPKGRLNEVYIFNLDNRVHIIT